MRLVLDTNVVIAGLLWRGPPRHLLDLAIDGKVTLFSSPALIDELAHTLNYPKFSQRIAAHCATTPSALTVRYGALVTLVTPTEVPRVIDRMPMTIRCWRVLLPLKRIRSFPATSICMAWAVPIRGFGL